MAAWRVCAGFPRLTRSAVPAAITEAEYVLDPRGLASHAVDPAEVLAYQVASQTDG